MTSYFPFVPNVQAPFTFQPTLDRRQFAASVTWNLFGQRWYLNLSQQNGTPIFTLPLLGSPDGTAIESLTWDSGTATVVTALPHNYPVGSTVAVTISGCAPAAYNGLVLAFIVDGTTFTYPVTSITVDATQLGTQIYNLNLAAGYFDTSTLVYRASSSTFEVTP